MVALVGAVVVGLRAWYGAAHLQEVALLEAVELNLDAYSWQFAPGQLYEPAYLRSLNPQLQLWAYWPGSFWWTEGVSRLTSPHRAAVLSALNKHDWWLRDAAGEVPSTGSGQILHLRPGEAFLDYGNRALVAWLLDYLAGAWWRPERWAGIRFDVMGSTLVQYGVPEALSDAVVAGMVDLVAGLRGAGVPVIANECWQPSPQATADGSLQGMPAARFSPYRTLCGAMIEEPAHAMYYLHGPEDGTRTSTDGQGERIDLLHSSASTRVALSAGEKRAHEKAQRQQTGGHEEEPEAWDANEHG